eukprot:Hpha_TRINITY_DN16076_c0_g6::TRINITY_DN16076_c0_g6_i1::g.119087::m.119087
MSHTIVLCQTSKAKSSRIYSDFETLNDALDGVCQMYETRLKQQNPVKKHLEYDIGDLLKFVDSLTDLSLLVFDNATKLYRPYGRDWVKNKVFQHLRRQAT